MKAYDWDTEETVDLDAAFDLSFKTEYLISDTFSAFVQLNNIASNKYPLFYNYPSRGFQAMAGITWKFK
jgi:outer membrane cobalamin receptor